MYCKKCGTQLSENGSCSNCGYVYEPMYNNYIHSQFQQGKTLELPPLEGVLEDGTTKTEKANLESVKDTLKPEKNIQEPAEKIEKSEKNIQNTYNNQKKCKEDKDDDKTLKIVIASILVVSLVSIIIGIISMINDKKDKSYDTLALNMAGEHIVDQNDDYLFYINNIGNVVRMDISESNKFTGTNMLPYPTDTTERVNIVENAEAEIIYINDDTVFYLSEKDHSVYACGVGGENNHKVFDDKCEWFTIVDDSIFYINGYEEYNDETEEYEFKGDKHIYNVNLKGKKRTEVLDKKVEKAIIYKDYIVYYQKEKGVYCYNTENEESSLLIKKSDKCYASDFKVYKDYVYYNVEDDGLYAISLKDQSKIKVCDFVISEFTFVGNTMYYTFYGMKYEQKVPYILDYNNILGVQFMSCVDEYGSFLNTTDNYVYYKNGGIISQNTDTNNKKYITSGTPFSQCVFTDDYVVYLNNRDDQIYRMDKDGTDITKLTNADFIQNIYCNNNKIYYTGTELYSKDGDGTSLTPVDGLFCIELNGGPATLIKSDIIYEHLIFSDNYAIYVDHHIFYINLDDISDTKTNKPYISCGNNEEFLYMVALEDDCAYIVTEETVTYNSFSNSLIRINLFDGSRETLVPNLYPFGISYDGENKIYYHAFDEYANEDNYQDHLYLRRINCDGTNDSIVMKLDYDIDFRISGNAMYYTDTDDGCIYRLSFDGSGATKLTDQPAYLDKIQGDTIYYTDQYNHGAFCSMDIYGNNKKVISQYYDEFVDNSSNQLNNANGETVGRNISHKEIDFAPTDIMTFEDPEFEAFLCTMFNKEPGTITGADLLSVQYFGYYEGNPSQVSELQNIGNFSYLMENSVIFSTQLIDESVNTNSLISGNDMNDSTSVYRNNCTVVRVRSNEWMAKHVFPYLYYFKSLDNIHFGYCWVGHIVIRPGTGLSYLGTHGRYDGTLYDDVDYDAIP